MFKTFIPKPKKSTSRFDFAIKQLMASKSNRSTSRLQSVIVKRIIPDCKRSQTAIEFLILIALILFFFTTFFLAIGENISDKSRENINKIINEVAITVQDEISLATESGDGYSRNFRIPFDINGLDYDISITDGYVYIKTDNTKDAIALHVFNVTGEIIKGDNYIKKESGIVYLNPQNE